MWCILFKMIIKYLQDGNKELELTPEQKKYYEMGFMCGYIERLRINKEEADEQFNNKPKYVK